MCAALGGRAAEQVAFGKISTGALSDLEKITKQAYASVSIFGLNDKLGNISYYDSQGNSDYSMTKPYSEKTAELIDNEVKKMIDEAYQKTLKLLTENRPALDKLAETLLEKEVIFREDLELIFGKRKWDKEEESATTTPTTSTPDPAPAPIENNISSENTDSIA
jgi:cell division protease FtsH